MRARVVSSPFFAVCTLSLLSVPPSAQYAVRSFYNEDHTVGNTLRYMLNKSPEVTFVGYSVPHPAEPKMNLRLQTSGKPATDVLLDTLGKVFSVGEHVDTTFKSAVADFRRRQEQEALAQPDAPVALQ